MREKTKEERSMGEIRSGIEDIKARWECEEQYTKQLSEAGQKARQRRML